MLLLNFPFMIVTPIASLPYIVIDPMLYKCAQHESFYISTNEAL